MQDKELNNGRLAMIAIAAFVVSISTLYTSLKPHINLALLLAVLYYKTGDIDRSCINEITAYLRMKTEQLSPLTSGIVDPSC